MRKLFIIIGLIFSATSFGQCQILERPCKRSATREGGNLHYSSDTPYIDIKDKTGRIIFQVDTFGHIDTTYIRKMSFDSSYTIPKISRRNEIIMCQYFYEDRSPQIIYKIYGDTMKAIDNLYTKYLAEQSESERLRKLLLETCNIALAGIDLYEDLSKILNPKPTLSSDIIRADRAKHKKIEFRIIPCYEYYWYNPIPSVYRFNNLIQK